MQFVKKDYAPPVWTSPIDSEGLNTLLKVISKYPGVKAKDCPKFLNQRPTKTIERQIKTLIEKGLIERRGSRKTGGYWLIIKKKDKKKYPSTLLTIYFW